MSETFHGHECTEVLPGGATGEPMVFSVPTPEQLAASVQPGARREQAADWLFDQIALHGFTDEVAELADRLCHVPDELAELNDVDPELAELNGAPASAEVHAETNARIREQANAEIRQKRAVTDALALAREGQYDEAAARLEQHVGETGDKTFADRERPLISASDERAADSLLDRLEAEGPSAELEAEIDRLSRPDDR